MPLTSERTCTHLHIPMYRQRTKNKTKSLKKKSYSEGWQDGSVGKVLTAKPNDLKSSPRACMVEELTPTSCPLTPPHT